MLSDLPLEILNQITSHLSTARSVSSFSQTCRRLHGLLRKEAWRVFVQHRFPSIPIIPTAPATWVDVAESLTALSRAWDRKAFLARYIEPPQDSATPPLQGARGRRNLNQRNARSRGGSQQTMGYRPIVDSYEAPSGKGKTGRKEVVAWGAGSELIARVKSNGSESEGDWAVYNGHGQVHGRDDISSVNILRPTQSCRQHDSYDREEIIVGRASGSLAKVSLPFNPSVPEETHIKTYETRNRAVRSAHVSPAFDPLLAASLSDETIAIFRVHGDSCTVDPSAELSAFRSRKGGRSWCTRFLSAGRLAVGLGPSVEPIHIYDIRPDDVSLEPARRFCTAGAEVKVNIDARLDTGAEVLRGKSSVFAIQGLPLGSTTGRDDGDVFLGGWYDGMCRLHDMRSPLFCVSTYHDPIDAFTPIYSLAAIGRERFVAGAARHSSMKIFDLRMAGGRAYSYIDGQVCSSSNQAPPNSFAHHAKDETRESRAYRRRWPASAVRRNDCTVFVSPKDEDPRFFVEPRFRTRSRRIESPIYSLSSPAASSQSLYVGMEETVVQFDVVSCADQVRGFSTTTTTTTKTQAAGPPRAAHEDMLKKWDPRNEVINLASYDHVNEGPLTLKTQTSLRDLAKVNLEERVDSMGPGLDIRWTTNSR
ncbi:MAG: hypothetical protein M1837_004218 [Sclerophora amabilis]|nr:MAG: hypothetical protein M1837_004218 [Sclerophora amabilis]